MNRNLDDRFRFCTDNCFQPVSDPAYVRRNSEIIAIKNLTASLLPFVHAPDSDKNALNLLLEQERELFRKIEDMDKPMIFAFLKNATEKLSQAFGNQAKKNKVLGKILGKVKVTNSGDKNSYVDKVKTEFFAKIKSDNKASFLSPSMVSETIIGYETITDELVCFLLLLPQCPWQSRALY